jgi:hypothetical protein
MNRKKLRKKKKKFLKKNFFFLHGELQPKISGEKKNF